jgi:hypothetical protein
LNFYTNNGQLTDDCPAAIWANKLAAGVRQLGMDPFPASQLEGWMRDAGFINMKSALLPLPLGPWPKDEKLVGCPSSKDILLMYIRKSLVHMIFINS